MVKIILLRSTTLEKSGSGVLPSFCSSSPRDMVRLQYMSLFGIRRCRLRAIARPIDPRPYCLSVVLVFLLAELGVGLPSRFETSYMDGVSPARWKRSIGVISLEELSRSWLG